TTASYKEGTTDMKTVLVSLKVHQDQVPGKLCSPRNSRFLKATPQDLKEAKEGE
ncbi:hypothetical protein SK128_008414, partial [Halocaridina rubra]